MNSSPDINQTFIIFLHIQKTAGITLQRMLRSRYGPHLLQRTKNLIQEKLNSSPDPVSLKKRLSSITMQDQYFMGHFCYGIHKFLPYPYTYITFLREPISRLLSLYRYSKLNSSAYYHGLARNASPKEFFFESNLMELDNGMLRFILGNPPDYGDLFINRTPVGKCNEDMLKQAKQNIENEFSFVGIVEKFDESVLLLKKQLNWKNPYYLRRNTYKNTNQNQPLTSSSWDFSDLMIEKLKEKNKYDMALYQFAYHQLEKQLESFGDEFLKEIYSFKKKNFAYNKALLPIYNKYDTLKAFIKGENNRPI